MALRASVVVEVVRASDLDAAATEFLVHKIIGDHRDFAVAQGQVDELADQVLVAFVVGVHAQRAVGQHRLRARRGNVHAAQRCAIGSGLRTVAERVQDVPHEAVALFAFHLKVGDRALQNRVPIDQALATVNQALLIELHKGFGDRFGQLGVHGEVFAAPVHAVAHAAHLGGDGVATLFLPLPDLVCKGLAAQVMAADFLVSQLALHHDLGGNAGMVGAGNPGGVKPLHAVVACQAVHDGLVERVAHVQGASHVGWRQLDAKRGRIGLGCLAAAVAGDAVATLLPLGAPIGFQGRRLKGFGEGLQPGLRRWIRFWGCWSGSGVGHVGISSVSADDFTGPLVYLEEPYTQGLHKRYAFCS